MTEDIERRSSTLVRRGPILIVLSLFVLTSACFLAPAPIEGASEGSACATDLECASGLICGCGTCAPDTPSFPRNPPSCDVSVDNRCPSTPSGCFVSCGVEVIVGIAECVAGRETCDANGGVLFDECPAETCWGEPEAGEICVNGQFECAFGRNGPTGLCYTFDCDGAPEQCVTACASNVRTTQACLGNIWKCEVGFPVRQCGGCVGTPPPCVESCDEPFQNGSATCVDDAWSCSASGGELESVCCDSIPGGDVVTLSDVEAIEDATCLLNHLHILNTNDLDVVVLPNLRRVNELFVASTSVSELHIPALARVDGHIGLFDNPLLREVDLSSLAYVGGGFAVLTSPALDVCALEDLVATIESREGIVGVVELPASDGGCAAEDAGITDAGLEDAGAGDAGVDDDAGQSGDAGTPEDAGTQDDAGSTDGGTENDAGTPTDAG